MSVRKRKVAVIGAGFVGSSIVFALMLSNIADEIVLIDSNEEKSKAEVADIRHGISMVNSAEIYCGSFSDVKDCDLIIMTAGRNRRPGETRVDLKNDNLKIAESVCEKIKKYYNFGAVLVVTNPVEIITKKFTDELELPFGKVFGTGCALDSSRLSTILGDYLNVPPYAVNSYVVGGHGESSDILWNRITVSGVPLDMYCEHHNMKLSQSEKDRIAETMRKFAMDIIKGKGRTHFGISSCVCGIADAVINGREIVSCVACSDNGNLPASVPSIIGLGGIKEQLTYMR